MDEISAEARKRLQNHLPSQPLFDGETILDRFLSWVSEQDLTPYAAQEEALLELMTGRHVILSTPTGSGKSLVAQGLHFKAMCEGRRSFYTAPIKALVSEKFFELCHHFGAENVGMLTGDASLNRDAPILCCTAEILSNMALTQGKDADAPYVVMDEFHYYGDRSRGMAWQIPLIRFPDTQFLLMSATLGDTSEIERHIQTRTRREISRVHSEERPVPLDFDFAEIPIHESVEALLSEGKAPVYIVHFTQRAAAEQAQALTSARITNREERKAISEAIGDFRFDTPYGKEFGRILKHGIGLHHAGLLPKYRLLVEHLAGDGLLRVICGTDTLGMGVNIPIRTVLFTQLCKFDGEKVGILSVRDFKQIAGRAGRKGFDDAGSVVAQAPEHVIANKRLKERSQAKGSRRKVIWKKPPKRGFVNWTQDTFQKLVWSPPEKLESRFRISHGLIINCLKSNEGAAEAPGYHGLAEIISQSHEPASHLRRHRIEAARLFRSLTGAGLVEIVSVPQGGRRVQVSEKLQRDFSLHNTLSLYLVEAATALDPTSADYVLDLLAVSEAILDDPFPILIQQERKAKGELIAKLKADRVPYEERMEKVDKITWPKPAEDFLRSTFAIFEAQHPWVGSDAIRPKGIARDLYESTSSFHDWVKRMEIARVEGVLLRYLGQVHNTLARSIPESLQTEEVKDMIGYFRAMIAQVDSSLLEAWENMINPVSEDKKGAPPTPREYDLNADPRGLRARIRSELRQLVSALAMGHVSEAPSLLHPDCRSEWKAEHFTRALEPFYAEYETIVQNSSAKQAHLCVIDELEPRRFRVRQVLVDPRGDNFWAIEGEVDLRTDGNPSHPLLQLRTLSD